MKGKRREYGGQGTRGSAEKVESRRKTGFRGFHVRGAQSTCRERKGQERKRVIGGGGRSEEVRRERKAKTEPPLEGEE